MKYTVTNKANKEKFINCFKKHIPHSSSCLFPPQGIDKGENCGYIAQNRFCIWKNIGIRNLGMLFLEMLQGEIAEDGTVTYKFIKRTDGNIFTLGFIIVSLIAGIIFGFLRNEWGGAAVLFGIAFIFLLLRLIHSKSNREHLLFTLETVINESNVENTLR
ncbi:MAG: hypothetical protein IJX55_11000 [Clostridia bacterium]|nr:hypothetical protein [Clostridia bacterium]